MIASRELLASAQMRDRIVAFLVRQAIARDRKAPDGSAPSHHAPKAKLLHGLATEIAKFPAAIAHGEPAEEVTFSPEMQDLIRKVSV